MFSEELEKISWEETTKAIYSKTDADVRRALGKEHCDVNHITCRHPLSGSNGATQSKVHNGTFRKDDLHVCSLVPHQLMYQFMRLLWFSH